MTAVIPLMCNVCAVINAHIMNNTIANPHSTCAVAYGNVNIPAPIHYTFMTILMLVLKDQEDLMIYFVLNVGCHLLLDEVLLGLVFCIWMMKMISSR